MSNKKTPLEEEFGLNHVDFPEISEIKIPDDPVLGDVVRLALEAYKDQMQNIQFMEPKYRARALEVAQQYLNLAKDALSKKEDLRQKDIKLNSLAKGKNEGGLEENDNQPTIKKSEIFKMIKGGKD